MNAHELNPRMQAQIAAQLYPRAKISDQAAIDTQRHGACAAAHSEEGLTSPVGDTPAASDSPEALVTAILETFAAPYAVLEPTQHVARAKVIAEAVRVVTPLWPHRRPIP